MPLWRIYSSHAQTAFGDATARKQLVEAITPLYVSVGLPPFYVNVIFIDVPTENIYVGGETRSSPDARPFVRITIEHIARTWSPGISEQKIASLNRFDAALKPHIEDRGYDWEYHILETDRTVWKINGMVPPLPKTDEERYWREQNRPLPYDGAYPEGNVHAKSTNGTSKIA